MITAIVDAVNELATLATRTSRFGWFVRGGILATAAALVALMWATHPTTGTTVASVLLVAGALVTALVPDRFGSLPMAPALVWWLLVHPLRPWQLALFVLLVWAAHRLACWAATGPSHAVVRASAVRMLLVDAAKEFGWLVATLALLLGGRELATRVPSGGNWAALLLGLLAAGALAWLWTLTSPRRR